MRMMESESMSEGEMKFKNYKISVKLLTSSNRENMDNFSTNVLYNILFYLDGYEILVLSAVCKNLRKKITDSESCLIFLLEHNSATRHIHSSKAEDETVLSLSIVKKYHLPFLIILSIFKKSNNISANLSLCISQLIVETVSIFDRFSDINTMVDVLERIVIYHDSVNIGQLDSCSSDQKYIKPSMDLMCQLNVNTIAHLSPDLDFYKKMVTILNLPYSSSHAYHIICNQNIESDSDIFGYAITMLKDNAHLIGKDSDQISISSYSILLVHLYERKYDFQIIDEIDDIVYEN